MYKQLKTIQKEAFFLGQQPINNVMWNDMYMLGGMVNSLKTAVVVIDPNQCGNPIVYINEAFKIITGYSIEEVKGKSWIILQGDKTDGAAVKNISRAIRKGEALQCELLMYKEDLSSFWGEIQLTPCFDQKGNLIYFVGLFNDITKAKKNELMLNGLNSLMDMIYQEKPIETLLNRLCLLVEKLIDGTACSAACCDDPKDYERYYEANRKEKYFSLPVFVNEKNDDLLGMLIIYNKIKEELSDVEHAYLKQLCNVFGLIMNNSYAKKKMMYQLTHDELTNLPNRAYFNQFVNKAIAMAKGLNNRFALLFFDIDRFQSFNKSLGYVQGNELLKLVAERLQKNNTYNAQLSRYSGDQFMILLEDFEAVEEVESFAANLLKQFEEPFYLGEHELFLNASIGASIYPDESDTFETLIEYAGEALSHAKEKRGSSYALYDEKALSNQFEPLLLENQLRKAIERQELSLYYQPQFRVQTGEVIGAEALMRWHNEKLGFVSPADFIPIAEETGLILPIGEWALKEACRQNKEWQEMGLPPITVSVNLSIEQFRDHALAEFVQNVLTETGIDPKYLSLEITESLAMEDMALVIPTLHELRNLGVSLAIDDFGTGYSSLSYLKDLPLHTLKIDKSFLDHAGKNSKYRELISTIIQLSHTFDMTVVAEGVEEEKQLIMLKGQKCDTVQGYLLSKPLAQEEMTTFLQTKMMEKNEV